MATAPPFRTLTLDRLKSARACSWQLKLFANLFESRVEVTEALCIRYADKFNFDWAAINLLGFPARAEYGAKINAALAEFGVKAAQAWAVAYIGDV